MPDLPPDAKALLLAEVDMRLSIWRKFWVGFIWAYFLLGVLGVMFSTIAASTLVPDPWRALLSLGSAVCLAVIGFLRPEARYKNLMRAWRDLADARARYMFDGASQTSLLDRLHDCERIATDDEPLGTQNKETANSPIQPPPPDQHG